METGIYDIHQKRLSGKEEPSMGIKIPLGIESFGEIRDGDYYYVDKTAFIREILSPKFEVNLITRPRRFGKSLMMSMLEDFFDISRDSRAHFDGLVISKEKELCEKWMNQWPVVLLSLKDVEGLTYNNAFGMLRVLISELCKKYAFLYDSDRVDPADRQLFEALRYQKPDDDNLKSSLLLLTRMMAAHYGKPTILLIDEYDVPLAKAHNNGYYREMLDVIRAFLGRALKTNPYLKFGVVTGCLKISKESIFTGINNFVANTITVERFDESIGFTEAEVQELLLAAGFPDHGEEVRTWYDGYRFGKVDVYCPWDVLNHVAALMVNPAARPRMYWTDSSSNDVLYRLFENEEFDVNEKFEKLLAGESIRETITENLTYDSLEASEESLWSLLFMTGYLTLAKDGAIEDITASIASNEYADREMVVPLRIPNEEIKYIFQKSVRDWFKKRIRTVDRSEIFKAFWDGDADTAQSGISDLLFESISYHDYRESYYHAFVAGLFAGAGYIVRSNYEYGDGRPDVVILERRNRRALLLEVKHANADETLEHACGEALNQIRDKRYAEALDGYRTVLSYGIAFKGKECMVRQYTDSTLEK